MFWSCITLQKSRFEWAGAFSIFHDASSLLLPELESELEDIINLLELKLYFVLKLISKHDYYAHLMLSTVEHYEE
jgi:hypothetical protein